MTVKEIAQQLDGTQYPCREASNLRKVAHENGLVIVYGQSDDLMEFEGAITDEVGCYEGTTVKICAEGLIVDYDDIDKTDIDAMRRYFAHEDTGFVIEALWNVEGYSFIYKTDIPHETFEVLDGDDGTKYCRGIVFRLADAA